MLQCLISKFTICIEVKLINKKKCMNEIKYKRKYHCYRIDHCYMVDNNHKSDWLEPWNHPVSEVDYDHY